MRRQLERREIKVIARTSDPGIFVIDREGVQTLEKRRRIPESAFPAVRSRKWSNGLVAGRYTEGDDSLVPMSEKAEFNQELYPECDCFYVDGDQERPIDTLSQIKGFRKHGYRETQKQTKARLVRERDFAVEMLEALGFIPCADCHHFIKEPADYYHPADLIQAPIENHWSGLTAVNLCRNHYAERLERGDRYSGKGGLVDGLRAAHGYVWCEGCESYLPEFETVELPAWISKSGLDFKKHYCKALHASAHRAELKAELLKAA
jgi:hypothetical protein